MKKKLRAFISVTDKTDLEKFKRWTDGGHEIVSTGGTAKKFCELNIPCTLVEEVTKFPEILEGRVKSMHPKITGAMLGDTRKEKHVEQMKEHDIEPFALVVVNLYEFEKNPSIENIDVGGPTALRSAAKNAGCVTVVMDPKHYDVVIGQFLENGCVDQDTREHLAVSVFQRTATYDAAIAGWMNDQLVDGKSLFEPTPSGH